MIISVDVDYAVSDTPLSVLIKFPNNETVLDLTQPPKPVVLEFDLPICNQQIQLQFCCEDLNIIHNPLTINNIVLDCFYQSPKITYSGVPQGANLPERSSPYCNRLDFIGQLVYTMAWPFYKNIFK